MALKSLGGNTINFEEFRAEILLQLKQKKNKDTILVIEVSEEAVPLAVLICNDLKEEFQRFDVLPLIKVTPDNSILADETEPLGYFTIALVMATEELANHLNTSSIELRENFVKAAVKLYGEMSTDELMDFCKKNYPNPLFRP